VEKRKSLAPTEVLSSNRPGHSVDYAITPPKQKYRQPKWKTETPHSILNCADSLIGVRGQISEITNQRQNYNNLNSKDWRKIFHGIPQGSILGPLLFIIYANYRPIILEKYPFLFFSQKTIAYLRGKMIIVFNLTSHLYLSN
jgi:hypothetical protein